MFQSNFDWAIWCFEFLLKGVRSSTVHLQQSEVLATMVTAMFAVPGLQWDKPGHHLETFAGCMEVTKHEWMDWFGKKFMACFFPGFIDLSHIRQGFIDLSHILWFDHVNLLKHWSTLVHFMLTPIDF